MTPNEFRDFVRTKIPDAYLSGLEEIWNAYRDLMAVELIRTRLKAGLVRGVDPEAEIRLSGVFEFLKTLSGAKAPVQKPADVDPNLDINAPVKTKAKRLTKRA
jgi:hypothetical protein